MFHYFHALPSLCLITALAVCQSLTAQRVWDGESSGLWGTATNWSGNTVPNISEDVIFNNAADTINPIIVGGARTINSFTYSIAGSRVFSTTAGPHSITVSGNTVISLPTGQQLVIGSATAANNVDLITGTLLKNGAGELQLFGSLTGTLEMVGGSLSLFASSTIGAVSVSGGSLSLFASSTIGAVSVSGGTLTTRNSNALAGSSPVTLSGGTMRLISGLGRPIIAEAFGTIENLSDDAVRIPIMTEGTSGLGSLRIRSMISAASGTMTFSINPINHDGDLELENSGAGTSAGALGTVRINSAIGANVNNVTVRNTTTGTRGLQTVLLVSPNLYTGTTKIDANAQLEILAANIIPDSSAITINGTLNLRTFSETIGTLSGSGTVTKSTGSRTFTIGSGGGDGSFSGAFNNGTSGTLLVLKPALAPRPSPQRASTAAERPSPKAHSGSPIRPARQRAATLSRYSPAQPSQAPAPQLGV